MHDPGPPNQPGPLREIATSAARGLGRTIGAFLAAALVCAAVGGGAAWWYFGAAWLLIGAAGGAVAGLLLCVAVFYILNS